MRNSFPLSQKYIDFVNTTKGVTAEFLEGTTASGKTTVGAGVKFMRMVSASGKKLHAIAAKTTGKAEETIIQQDNGILDLHHNAVYCGNGDKDFKLPHIKFEGKIIYILGYDNRDKWEMALGAQFGCVYIDEINTADIEFVREISTRNEYLLATLNPDDPTLPVYKEFVNRSRPFRKYVADVPKEIMEELLKAEATPGWRYWFFSFRDNLSLTPEDIERKKAAAPKGTKLYKNKILGQRGKATGVIFDCRDSNIITAQQAREHKFTLFSAALDTAYSQTSPDTIAFTFIGITADRKCIVLDERV
ncbi:MAG: terminase, partial [Ruminococcus sp.]|nr:terminase [Ruminococcus sp.]